MGIEYILEITSSIANCEAYKPNKTTCQYRHCKSLSFLKVYFILLDFLHLVSLLAENYLLIQGFSCA